ncbi:MAG: ornithine carbamoyltransferase, partial [Gammaproteobacteria bacterium]|nr:ornithine carbamoyltransferase [Gammaproteobacteria bacterium]
MAKRDFLTLLDCSPAELGALTERAAELKRTHLAGENHRSLAGRTGALILQVSSTRTRVAFEAGMAQLGGQAIFLSPADTQLARGEPISDTARVLSQMVDVAMIRILSHDDLETFAAAADIPVINAMTARYHPCQLLADVQTFEELRGPIGGRRVAFIGDGYNMCSSYINAARQWGFELRLACPPGHEPPASALATGNAHLFETPQEAVEGAHLVVTDVWSSIGHEEEQAQRRERFAPYQVSEALLDGAADGNLLLHSLPPQLRKEVNATVLDAPR